MKKTSIIAAAAAICAFAAAAPVYAQDPAATATTTTTTTNSWSPDEGQQLTQTWTTNKYTAPADPSIQVSVGTPLPPAVTFYPLPENINVPDRDKYSYTVINSHPVVVERSTRRVVHVWN